MSDFLQSIFSSSPLLASLEISSLSLPSLANTTSFVTVTFWKYLPFTPFLILFWPLVISFIFSLTSASTWLFWLFTSLIFGAIQLIYVLYQFMMISIDLGVLSLLKTYSTMRTLFRYYTLKSGINKGNRQDQEYVSRRGRKREWRKKIDGAKSLGDFLKIEIQEPPPSSFDEHNRTTDASASNNINDDQGEEFPQLEKEEQKQKKQSLSPVKKLRHVLSTPNFQQDLATPSSSNLSTINHNGIEKPNFHRSKSNIELDKDKSKKENKIILDHDAIVNELGMTGKMLLQTTFRLRETRLQASSTYKAMSLPKGYVGGGEGLRINNGFVNSSNQSNSSTCITEEEDDDDFDEINHDETFNLTTPILSSQQQENSAASQLKFFLHGVVKRNHLSINDLLIQDALSVMDCGRHHLSEQSRTVILNYHEEVEHCLKWIAQFGLERKYFTNNNHSGHQYSPSSPFDKKHLPSKGSSTASTKAATTDMTTDEKLFPNYNNQNINNDPDTKLYKELSDRLNLIRKLKHNMGRTALMLSGGGAQAMYHLGTIKALCESELYDDIEVISGTSGGSIAAAMCAVKKRTELLTEVCVPHVSTDYGLTGEMKKKNIRWFPRVTQMGEYWLKHKLLVNPKEFKRCCDFYFGDITFEEAFDRTGKHVCITVSASRAEESGGSGGSGGSGQRLLLNHISTPHVTLASAVAASCALPGVMAPAKLVTKNKDSKQELFEVDGVEWIDGSVQADLPFKRISTLFNVSNYIVCQTNFHVLPFLHKAHHPNTKSFYWRAFQTCEWDIRNRALNLSRLGLFPKIFGQDISKVFKQKYHGDLTLVPRFTTMQVLGLKALVNPTYEDMEVYLQNGQSSAWPYLSVIKEMLRLETAIDKCIKSLNERRSNLSPENEWDDVDSITSVATSRHRTLGARRENELLKQKIHSLEIENLELKKQIELIKRECGIKFIEEALPMASPTAQIEFVQQKDSNSSKRKTKNCFWKKD